MKPWSEPSNPWRERMTAKQKWFRTLAWLRREFPADKTVTVRTIIPGNASIPQGEIVQESYTRFSINIKRQCLSLKIDAVIHEWAHLLTWHGNDEDEHGEEWSLMYGRIYRAWLIWNYGRTNDQEEN